MPAPRPFGLLAELTYRCALRCPYCSNPLQLGGYGDELTPEEWRRVLGEARVLGVLQVHFSGGEPLQRRDLPALVSHAHGLGCYTNLITNGLALSPARIDELQMAGLDHVQISLQAADAPTAERIAGAPSFQRKLSAARAVKAAGFPLTLNVVLHRLNLDQLPAILEVAEQLGAHRLELANTQYYGWALRNRAALLPSRAQLAHAESVVRAARKRLAGTMEIVYVLPDYYEEYPKPCMHGWGHQQLTVTPIGAVLPCPAAAQLTGLAVENVRERPLAWIWDESPMFARFRGVEWMPDPCRTCARRLVDFGGCRCQAFQLTGDAAATDPVCRLSPHHRLIEEAVRAANDDQTVRASAPEPAWVYRARATKR